MSRLRRSEWVIIVYFTYTAILPFFLEVRPPVRRITVAVNAAVILGLLLAVYAYQLRNNRLFSYVRDWYPAPLMILAYREMGWFAPPYHTYQLEQSWVVWDRMLLNQWGLKALIELSGPVLPGLLELSYSLVYTMAPFAMAMLYAYGKRNRMDGFLFTFLVGIYSCYTLFPCFPSEPPRTVFPGEDFPSVYTVFRRFNWALLGGYGIHTSVFPSAHAAGAFSAAFAAWRELPEQRWVGRLLLVLAVLIAIAIVYGRYHYAVDALAGFGASLLAVGASRVAGFRGSAHSKG